jgi:hypothetical protein
VYQPHVGIYDKTSVRYGQMCPKLFSLGALFLHHLGMNFYVAVMRSVCQGHLDSWLSTLKAHACHLGHIEKYWCLSPNQKDSDSPLGVGSVHWTFYQLPGESQCVAKSKKHSTKAAICDVVGNILFLLHGTSTWTFWCLLQDTKQQTLSWLKY